ncbi:MAG: flagellar assembly peptidoglycan hydrolase FlgJ [Ideonella sp.]|nr:flagellar assembly peptidoglycan hydrolase FlgJ [Ideonella sp.]
MSSISLQQSASGLAGDVRGLDSLRLNAGKDPKGAARAAAKQFEALFMQEIMKSMRATTMASGLTDNAATKLGTDMLDTQLATKMSGLHGGLADVIARQLERQMGLQPGPIPSTTGANLSLSPMAAPGSTPRIPEKSAAGFIAQHSGAAEAAEKATGIPAAFMLSQAALESGWGKKEITATDGTPSNNLFGIKAGPNWKGPVAEVMTTEYVGGKAQKVLQKFRAYASHAESFADYAKLIKDSPRYERVVAAGGDAKGFAQGLQRAGYATDPAYADKLSRVINTTLRLQRGQV